MLGRVILEQSLKLGLSYEIEGGCVCRANPSELASKSCFQLQCKVPPLLIGQQSSSRSNRPFAKAVDELAASETPDIIPTWVSEAALRSKYSEPPELKSAFLLLSAEGSGLPSLFQSRLHAPRILKMTKIRDYVINELESKDNMKFEAHEPSPTDVVDAETMENQGRSTEDEQVKKLEFTCNGKAIPSNFTIGAVKAYLWRRPEPEIKYRVYNRTKPAPYAEVKSPTQ